MSFKLEFSQCQKPRPLRGAVSRGGTPAPPPKSDPQTDPPRCYEAKPLTRGLEPSNSVLMNQNQAPEMTLSRQPTSREGLHHEAGDAYR